MGKYDIRFDVSVDTVTLIYMGEVYHIDLTYLLFLYEKYGTDLFFFFYLFSGKQVSFPKATRFLKIMEFSQELMKHHPDILTFSPKTEQGKKVYQKLLELYDEKDNCFKVEMEVSNEKSGEVDIKSAAKSPIHHGTVTSDGEELDGCTCKGL